jgi:hypothetical protein
MKHLKITALAIVFFTIAPHLFGQGKEQIKPLIIQTIHVNLTESSMRVSMDSLLKIWKERVMKPNPYFVSTKIVKHWWGNDSRDVVFIFELKSWDDIAPAFEKRNEIIKAHKGWASDEDAKAFGKLWFTVFMNNPQHSDEIYQIVE